MEFETRSRDLQGMSWLGGIALGALAMFLADPSQGRRRRALLRDQINSASHKTSKLVGQTVRDARNRFAGLQAEAARLITPQEEAKPIDDHVLEARVRSRLGRSMSHLHQLEVSAHQGVVTLVGEFNHDELPRLLEMVQAIPGVEKVGHQVRAQHIETNRMRRLFSLRNALWIAGGVGAGLLTWYALGGKASSAIALLQGWGNTEQADLEKAQQTPSAAISRSAGRSSEAERSARLPTVDSVLH